MNSETSMFCMNAYYIEEVMSHEHKKGAHKIWPMLRSTADLCPLDALFFAASDFSAGVHLLRAERAGIIA